MPNATPLANSNTEQRLCDDARSSANGLRLTRLTDLEAERDALREMVKQAQATEMFLR